MVPLWVQTHPTHGRMRRPMRTQCMHTVRHIRVSGGYAQVQRELKSPVIGHNTVQLTTCMTKQLCTANYECMLQWSNNITRYSSHASDNVLNWTCALTAIETVSRVHQESCSYLVAFQPFGPNLWIVPSLWFQLCWLVVVVAAAAGRWWLQS